MTTRVTVDAHAGWPVKVTKHEKQQDGVRTTEVIVSPNTAQDFYVHAGLRIEVEEMPR